MIVQNNQIIQLDRSDLSDLLCTALYGNDNFGAEYSKKYEGLCNASDDVEDRWADILLNNGRITIFDAEDPEDLEYRKSIGLADIIDGLDQARTSDVAFVRDAYQAFIDFNLDLESADALLQVIAYGELIFG